MRIRVRVRDGVRVRARARFRVTVRVRVRARIRVRVRVRVVARNMVPMAPAPMRRSSLRLSSCMRSHAGIVTPPTSSGASAVGSARRSRCEAKEEGGEGVQRPPNMPRPLADPAW